MSFRVVAALLRRPLALLLGLAMLCTAMTVMASTGTSTWTAKEDFESNASTFGPPTSRQNIDSTSSAGDLRIGIPKDFITTATITCVTPNRIYTTGVQRSSVSVIDSATNAVLAPITLPGPAAGVVYNPATNKLYVGQSDGNKLTVIDAGNGTVTTLTIGTANGVYAAAYNPTDNKIYISNAGDQTVTILDGATDTRIGDPVRVTPGATTATFDANADRIYFTSKSNNYLTVIDGVTNRVLRDIKVEPVIGLLGGQASGNVGLRLDAGALGVTGADNIYLRWNADQLTADQNIQFQVRTAADAASLDAAAYHGPDNMTDAWYDLSSTGVSSSTEADGTVTSSVALNLPYAPAAEIQLKLSDDGITSPVLHEVSLTYGFTISASAGSGGIISPAGDVIVPFGGSQTFAISPNTGYHVSDVTVDGASQGTPSSYTFSNVTASHSIAASFAVNTYTITASAGAGGSITPSGAVTVNYGQSQSFSIDPQLGYRIVDVVVDGHSVGAVSNYTFDNVMADHTISASFAIITFTITPSAGPAGVISPASAVTLNYGASQAFTIAPNVGYHIADVVVDGRSVGPVSAYTFDNVTADHTISATFAINTYTITASATTGGTISPSGAVTVNYGGSASFAIAALPYYHLVDVVVDGSSQGAITSYTFNSVTANHSISASFAIDTYTITATAGPGGTISPSGTLTVNGGSSQTFTITPNSGCSIASVTVDGVQQGTISSYTFNNVGGNHTISATFIPSSSGRLVQAWSIQPPNPGYGGAPDNVGNFFMAIYPTTSYVYRFNSSGVLDWTSTTANSGGSNVATDNFGNVYSQNDNGYVYKFTPPATNAVWTLKFPGAIVGSGYWPMMVDNKGYLYASTRLDQTNYPYRIYKIRTSDGAIVWSATTSLTQTLSALVVDSQGKIYVTAYPNTTIYKYDPAVGSNPVATIASAGVAYLAIDGKDNLYVLSSTKLTRMDTNGNVSWSVNSNPSGCKSVATDGVNVYIGNDKYLTMYDANTGGVKQTLNNVPSAEYNAPMYLATDGYGLVYAHSTNSNGYGPITKFTLQ